FEADGVGGGTAAHVDPDGNFDDCRGAFVRGIVGAVSACGRAVRLFAGGVFAVVGIFVWLDAVPGDSDRDDRGRVDRVLALSGSSLPGDLSKHMDSSAD